MGVELQTIRPAGSRYTDRLQCLIGFYYSSTGDYAEFPHSTKWLAQILGRIQATFPLAKKRRA